MRRAILLLSAGALCWTAAACSRNQAAPAGDVTGITWQLVEVDGTAVDAGAVNRTPTLLLGEDGRASGNAGCNQFGGAYSIDGDELSFNGVAMTRMACPGRMDVESAYAAVFNEPRRWRVVNGMLELLSGERVLARFRRQE